MNSRKIRMLVTHRGSPDGINVNEYQAGQKYDLPERLAQIFLDAGYAEEDRAFDGPEEIKEEPVKKKKVGKKGSKK